MENGKVRIQWERDKPVALFDFIAWKDDRQSFYARPRNGKPRVVKLIPNLPPDAVSTGYPFPECAPVEIKPCCLLPPPCRESEEEWETVLPDNWEAVYLKTHGRGLHLTREDDKELRARMAAYKKAKRAEYERDRKAAQRIKEPIKREREIEEIEREYNAPLHTFEGLDFAGSLNMTLGMVKRGFEGIRDTYLVEWWAKHEGIDLNAMWRDRTEFRKWIEAHAGLPAIIHDMRMEDKRRGLVSPGFHGDNDPRFMELCAAIRFRVDFSDGTAVYLKDCPPPRKELRAEEWKELKREHKIETAHERKVKVNRKRGAQRAASSRYSSLIVQAAKKKYRELKPRYPKSKIEAARRTAQYLDDEHGEKPEPETILNWVEGKTRGRRKKTL
jgi:hypothetical protein